MQLSFFGNITTTAGTQVTMTWAEATEYLTKHEIRKGKEGPLYSPAIYSGTPQRADCNVVSMAAVVIDVDNDAWIMVDGKKTKICVDKPTAPDDHEDNLGDIAYFWHSTHSNKPDHPKFRYVIPLSRPVLPHEWPVVFAGAVAMLGNDENIDGSCKDLSRSYYLPSCPPEFSSCKFSGCHEGEFIDPDYLIEVSGMQVDCNAASGSVNGMFPAAKVEGRNNTLKSIVSACLERGEAVEKIITEVLVADSNHAQPLFSDKGETQYSGIPAEISAQLFVARITASHARNAVKRGQTPDIPHIRTESAYAMPDVIEMDPTVKAATIATLPDIFLNPPGFLGDVARWIDRCAIKSQPVLSLAAAIAACGTLFGRKVQTDTGLRTNLYIVGLGETSCGKENARQRVKDLFVASGCQKLLGPEELASDTGLLRAVKASPAVLLQIDEIGHMLRAVKSDKASSYKADILPTLMKLESAASSVMIGRGYASTGKAGKDGTEREDIVQPCVCLYGSSVPCRFLKSLTPDEILDGFVPRMIVFESEDPNPKRRKVDIETLKPPTLLTNRVKSWYERTSGPGNLADYQPDSVPRPKVVRFSSAAAVIFDKFEEVVRTEQDKCRSKGMAGLWGKTEAQAMKLALIYACSEDFNAETISPEAAMWGIGIMSILTHNMMLRSEQHISANQNESDLKKLLRDIMEAGSGGIGHSDLYRRNRKHGTRTFKDFIAALKDQREIVEQAYQVSNRTGIKYVSLVFKKGE